MWTDRCENAATALSLYQQLLPDVEDALGRTDYRTLAVRHSIALWTGHLGDTATALDRARELLRDYEQVFGPANYHTINLREQITCWANRDAGAKLLEGDRLTVVEDRRSAESYDRKVSK